MRYNTFVNAIAAIAAVAFTSCALQEQQGTISEAPSSKTVTVTFTASDSQTKSAFIGQDESTGTYPVTWTSADDVISMSLNLAEPVFADVIKKTEVSRTADFTATFIDDGGPYKFYALSPAAASAAVSPSRSSWVVNIPVVQTPKADGLSCDEAAMVLYSVTDELEALPEGSIDLRFKHATTYCRLGLRNLDTALGDNGADGAHVKSVDVTYSVPVAGSWYLDPADGAFSEKEASYTITLKPVIDDLSQTTDIWFAMAPCTLDGQSVRISVNTDMGCLVREFTYGTRTYAAGSVNRLNLDMAKNSSFDKYTVAYEETVFQIVRSADELSVNDVVVFVDAQNPSYAMSVSASGTSGINSVSKDSSDGFSFSSQDGYLRLGSASKVAELVIASKNGSSMSFRTGNNYLSRNTGNRLPYLTYSTSSALFNVSVSAGNASVSYKGNGQTNIYIRHNSGYFNLTSSLSNCAIYKKTVVTGYMEVDPETDPVCNQEQYGAYLLSGNRMHDPGITQISREWGTDVTFSILTPVDNSVLEFSGIPISVAKGDAFTLTLNLIEGTRNTPLGSFEVNVVKEEGSKIWLSDFKGNGFIVKR